jgi:hypothetical protein
MKPQRYRHALFATLVALGTLSHPAFAQETVNTNRATDVRANPDDSAAVLQMLAPQTRVQVLERKGAWTRIKTDKETGWVRMMHLRGGATVTDAPQPSAGGGFLSGLNRLVGGSQPTTQRAQSATLGVRGLSPEELKSASPNPQALAQTKSFAASKPEAEEHAKAANLARADVPDPAKTDNRGGRR